MPHHSFPFFFFFNDTATTEIYPLSLHDALPICLCRAGLAERSHPVHLGIAGLHQFGNLRVKGPFISRASRLEQPRSEEHTSELQSPCNLACRLLLEKKNITPSTSPAQTRLPAHT